MSALFEGYEAAPFKARRDRLSKRLDGALALVPAGGTSSRNFLAQAYPYRASSHFLYLVGLPLIDGMLVVDGDEHTLFLPKAPDDDALWHGAQPGHQEIAERTGCRVVHINRLADALGGQRVATVPAPDPITRARQSALLGREVTPGRFDEADLPLVDGLIALRSVHDEAAIGGLRRAAAVTTAAHLAAMSVTRPGMREADVRAAFDGIVVAENLEYAYGPIVTVHGEVLHNSAHGNRIDKGDLLLADVGAEAEGGWAGDVTRTWPVSGKFSTTQREFYEVVLAAEEASIEAVKPGARYRDVHLASCRALAAGLVDLGVLTGDPAELVADGVHALFFPHGVGHLLGLDVHDMEDLGDRAGYAPGRKRAEQFGLSYLRLDRDLEVGMAVTIEPGLYQVPAILEAPRFRELAKGRVNWERLRDFADVRGIRIEDDVLVTDAGREVLTAEIPKTIDALEAIVGSRA
ncbi:MAG: aminopeptidase P family protein [Deltaproteobacteria bacterium]|nr:MAG: aminopeptidase P family protein [Deltaproteobacteria bacterium]